MLDEREINSEFFFFFFHVKYNNFNWPFEFTDSTEFTCLEASAMFKRKN